MREVDQGEKCKCSGYLWGAHPWSNSLGTWVPRDVGCGGYSAGTWLSPETACGGQLTQDISFRVAVCQDLGASQLAETLLGLGCATAAGDPPFPCSVGAGGKQLLPPVIAALGCLCHLLLYSLVPTFERFPPKVWLPEDGATPAMLTPGEMFLHVLRAWCGSWGWVLPISKSPVATAKSQFSCACHRWYRCH